VRRLGIVAATVGLAAACAGNVPPAIVPGAPADSVALVPPDVVAISIDKAVAVAPATPASPQGASYWDLVGSLNLTRLGRAAVGADQARFADALSRAVGGDLKRAESLLDSLRQPSTSDSLVRHAARLLLAGFLQTEHRWRELRMLAEGSSSRSNGANRRDRADVEAWAATFAALPSTVTRPRLDSVVFPVVLSTLGVPMLPVEVNGHRFLFWMDTGASMTMLASDVAEAGKVQALAGDSLEAATAVGRVPVMPAMLERLRVGPLEFTSLSAMIVGSGDFHVPDSVSMRHGAQKIDGIIGWDVLRQLDIRLDYPHGVLVMRMPRPQAAAAGAERNLLWLGYPLVRLTSADGELLQFGLDTGLQETFVTTLLPARLGLRPVAGERRRIGGIGSDTLVRVLLVPAVRLNVGDASLTFTRAVVYPAKYGSLVPLDGVLGADVGRGGVVRIDATNGIFRVTSR
jgi:hypothetical protein